ncbi:MAG: hypothetical protein HYS59_00395 [Candidatus Vogelbacteria bacterium]|nr:hypothetical protein [Candidatus Vogelbacteria bacterium]
MERGRKIFNILISVFVIIALIVVASFFVGGVVTEKNGTLSPVGFLSNTQLTDESVAGREFLQVLLNLRSIKLDTTLFGDPIFTQLAEFGTPLTPEPRGRTNPFAPL